MKTQPRKREHEKAVTFNITLPGPLVPELNKILQQYRFKGPSDYLQARVRKDAGLELPVS